MNASENAIAANAAMLRLFKNEYRESSDRHDDALFVRDYVGEIERALHLSEQSDAESMQMFFRVRNERNALKNSRSALVLSLEKMTKWAELLRDSGIQDQTGSGIDGVTDDCREAREILAKEASAPNP